MHSWQLALPVVHLGDEANDDSGGILSPCQGSLENEIDDYNAQCFVSVNVVAKTKDS